MEPEFLLFVVVAALYALVGHGGASGYLALMALLSFGLEEMRPTALVLNLVVSLIAFVAYYRAGHFRWALFWPFALASVPMAWLGGTMQLNPQLFRIVLGLFLLLAAARMVGWLNRSTQAQSIIQWQWALIAGGCIGFISGLIGIGGGIVLSPLILLLGWAGVKETAAVSALFIFVNSGAGLAGMYSVGANIHTAWPWLVTAVLCGGVLGGYLGSVHLSARGVQYVLALVLLLAAIKLIGMEL